MKGRKRASVPNHVEGEVQEPFAVAAGSPEASRDGNAGFVAAGSPEASRDGNPGFVAAGAPEASRDSHQSSDSQFEPQSVYRITVSARCSAAATDFVPGRVYRVKGSVANQIAGCIADARIAR